MGIAVPPKVILDIEKIKQRLFDSPKRSNIMKAYGIAAPPSTPDQFAETLIATLEQTPVDKPLEQDLADNTVFRAAVRSLGSNSRSWSTFLASEARLAELLDDYDPVAVSQKADGQDFRKAVKQCLPGQTSSNDQKAVLGWARLLADSPRFFDRVVNVGRAFARLAKERDESLSDGHLLLCVAGLLAYPPSKWKGRTFMSSPPQDMTTLKLPGMGYALTGEFLRNLGFSGFKPDRHVCRLFDRWFPEPWIAEETLSNRLSTMIGTKSKELRRYLTYSVKGINVTPNGIAYSHADNLVWLLGAYVETKSHESAESYVIRTN